MSDTGTRQRLAAILAADAAGYSRLTVEIRDLTVVQPMRVREVADEGERARLWALAVTAFPPYADYQAKTTRKIPRFGAEPAR